ncbi:MAG: VWA domain-containing protein [Gammaproteobacteria bacterium]|nr:VWA domain-containing protein [Gammaproteobacteria bacterium]
MHQFQKSLYIYAQILASNFGVKVQFTGNNAYTDGETINVPALDPTQKTVENVLWGYTVHEAAHIRYHSDFELAGKLADRPLEKHLTNLFEGIRIEQNAMKEFPGAKVSLDNLASHFKDEICGVDDQSNTAEAIMQWLYINMRNNILMQDFEKEVTESRPTYERLLGKGLLIKLQVIMFRARKQNSTMDAHALAKEVMHTLEEMKNEDSSHADKILEDQNSMNSSSIDQSKMVKQVLEHASSEARKEGRSVESKGNTQGRSASPHEIMEVAETEMMPRNRINKLLASTHILRAHLETLLQSQSLSKVVRKRRGKRLDIRKVASGLVRPGDDRFYRTKIHGRSIKTAVQVLIDASSSMRKDIEIAVDASIALTYALDSINGIKAGLACFPHGRDIVHQLTSIEHSLVQNVYRTRNIVANGGTPMTEALDWAISQFAHLSADRRIVFIVTDGQPNDTETMSRMLEYSTHCGIETIGIGIGNSNNVGFLFENSIKISSVEELGRTLFAQAQRFLVAA